MTKISEEEQKTKVILSEKYKEAFYIMFAKYVLDNGMDVRTAIYECWNQLECGGANG